jgi:hypothetical protein
MIRSSILTIALAFLGVAWTPVASAQNDQDNRTPTQQSAPTYTDDELKSFTAAALEVRRISSTYIPKIEAAPSPEEQQKVVQQAESEMVQAVEKQGMTADKYDEILTQAKTNPEVAQRVEQHLKNQQKGQNL